MNRTRVVSLLVVLAALTLISEGVIHDSHTHDDGAANATCAVCHNLLSGIETSVSTTRIALLPRAGAVPVPTAEFFTSVDRAQIDGTRAPPVLV